jgi:hypothetical protein
VFSDAESSTQPKDDDEAKTLKVIEDIVQKQGRRMNVPTSPPPASPTGSRWSRAMPTRK